MHFYDHISGHQKHSPLGAALLKAKPIEPHCRSTSARRTVAQQGAPAPTTRGPRHTHARHAQRHRTPCDWSTYCVTSRAQQMPNPPLHGVMVQTGRMQRPNLAPPLTASAQTTTHRPHLSRQSRAGSGTVMPLSGKHWPVGPYLTSARCYAAMGIRCIYAACVWVASPPQSIAARTGRLWQRYAPLLLKAPPPA